MRTSGAPTETALAYIPIGVAIVIIVMLFGGPWEFFKFLETALGGLAEVLANAIRSSL